MDEYSEYAEFEQEPRPRDKTIDEAKGVFLAELFDKNATKVFYERQIEVLYEGQFYHWISTKALTELVAEGKVMSVLLHLDHNVPIRFYWSHQNPKLARYWKRQANRTVKLVRQYSSDTFAQLLGHNGEIMFDQALPRAGFMPVAFNTRSYKGKVWTESDDNLDRIFERDGIAYGTEIKNTLKYIPRDELQLKTRMCLFLGIRPLFVVRSAPGNYIYETHLNGGFTLVFKYQLYPLSHRELAAHVREELGLPVDTPKAIEQGTVLRLLKNHEAYLKR